MAIPLASSLRNEISFINSGISHPRAGKTAVAPASPRRRAGTGRSVVLFQLWCRATNVMHVGAELKVRVLVRPGGGGRRMTPIRLRGRRHPLLHVDDRALLFQLGLETGRLVLRHASLHGLRRAVDQV